MIQTYNPILETVELSRFRFGSPPKSPKLGTALVFERDRGEPLTVWPGQRVPDARTGNYRRMHRIDTAPHGLAMTVTAPSQDAAFPFSVTVRCACKVTNPVVIARDGIYDMAASLVPSVQQAVRVVAAHFDAMHPTAAEMAITAQLGSAYAPDGVELNGFTASVSMVDAAEIVSARREIRVQGMRRGAMREVVDGGDEEMLAHVMSIDNGSPMEIIDRQRMDRAAAVEAQLEALKVLTNSSEDVDLAAVRKQTMKEFFPTNSGLAEKGRLRDRLKGQAAISGGTETPPESQPTPKPVEDE
jgi:hypothetical protein